MWADGVQGQAPLWRCHFHQLAAALLSLPRAAMPEDTLPASFLQVVPQLHGSPPAEPSPVTSQVLWQRRCSAHSRGPPLGATARSRYLIRLHTGHAQQGEGAASDLGASRGGEGPLWPRGISRGVWANSCSCPEPPSILQLHLRARFLSQSGPGGDHWALRDRRAVSGLSAGSQPSV